MEGFFVLLAIAFLTMPIVALAVAFSTRKRLAELERQLAGRGSSAVPVPPAAAPPDPPPSTPATAPPSPSRPRDWEGLLGGQVFNRAGAMALIVAAVFLLKHAYDRDWLAPWGPFLLGFAEGGLLLGGGILLARRARIFGQGVAGAGLAILYGTVHVGHGVAGLLPAALALALMLGITVLGIVVGLRQRSPALVTLALAGGFLTPLLVDADGGPFTLLAYTIPLALLGLAQSARTGWDWLDPVVLLGTHVVWIDWVGSSYAPDRFAPIMAAQGLNFALFLAAGPARRWPRGQILRPTDLLLWVGATVAMLLWLTWTFAQDGRDGVGFWVVGLALVQILLHRWVAGRPGELALVVRGTLVLALLLLVVAIPLELDDLAVTMLWVLQGGLVLWIARRAAMSWLAPVSLVMVAAAVGHLLLFDLYHHDDATGPTRHGAMLALVCLALGAYAWLAQREDFRLGTWDVGRWVGILAGALGLWVVTLELQHHPWVSPEEGTTVHQAQVRERWSGAAISIAWALYASVATVVGRIRRVRSARWFGICVFVLLVAKVILVDLAALPTLYRVASFLIAGLALLGISWLYTRERAG